MPLDVLRLRDSDLALRSTGDEFKAAVLLWCASWHQVPSGSLPNDDKVLRRLCGISDRAWIRCRDAVLEKWTLCSDGRLYHQTVAEKAVEAWEQRTRYRAKRDADRQRLQDWRDSRGGPETPPETPPETRFETRKTVEGTEGNGSEKESPLRSPQGESAEIDIFGPAPEPEKRPRRKPATALPENFPGETERESAAAAAKLAGVTLDIGREAERFRNHAASIDRRLSSWPAGFRNWIATAIERAPKARPDINPNDYLTYQ